MVMRPHPLIERELLQAARMPSTHLFRFTFATLAGVATLLLLLADVSPGATTGAGLLHVVTLGSFIFSLLSGLIFTADCVARERREGTLPLLFLSGMGAVEIVLAKLVSNGWRCLATLLLPLPFMATSLCLGGVEPFQIAGVVLGIFFLACFSLTAGLMVSCLGLSSSVGLLLYSALLLSGSAGMLANHFADGFGPRPDWSLIFNPIHPLLAAWLGPLRLVPTRLVAESLAGGCLVLLAMLVTAALALRVTIRPPLWLERVLPMGRRHTSSSGGRKSRRRLSASEFLPASLRGGWHFTRFTLGMAAFAGVLYANQSDEFFNGKTAATLLVASHFVMKVSRLWLGVKIGWMERNSDGMELLLTTPIAPGQILAAGKRRINGASLWADCVVVLLHLLYLTFEIQTGRVTASGVVALASLLVFILDRRTMVWLGLWEGMSRRGFFRGVMRAWLAASLAPTLITLAGYALLKTAFGSGFPDPSPAVLMSAWIAAAGLASAWASFRLWRTHADMRTIVAAGG